MNKPLVSVVIPAYNGAEILSGCLDSVLTQDYPDYEIIIVDNNSTDSTREIIHDYIAADNRIRYVFEQRKGRGSARNAGISAAQGKIIAMTDQDCVVGKNWLSELTKPIRQEGESAVNGFEHDMVGNYWTKKIQQQIWNFVKTRWDGRYVENLDTKNFAIRTAVIKELMFNSRIGNMEDFELFLRLRDIAKIRFLPSVRVGHMHRSSLMKWASISFDRGFWTEKIKRKHAKARRIEDVAMLQNLSLGKQIVFPFWMAYQFIRRPLGKAFFIMISETSWRCGALWAKITS